MSEEEARFVIEGVGRAIGILDRKKNEFAEFLGQDPVELRRRLERATSRLNSGEDTPTGYVWEKVPSQSGEPAVD